MPVKAYILVDTAAGSKTRDIIQKLKAIKAVQSAEAISGPHDMIVVAEAPDLQSLGDMVLTKIRTIEGVMKTITCCCV